MNKNIVSKKFNNLKLFADKNKFKYQKSQPFPHLVINGFFENKFLNSVLEEFPDLKKINSSINYNNKNEIKFANNNQKNFKKIQN